MIYVIDSIMGSGKTTAMIKQMNEHPEKRWLFITGRLDEVARITNECKGFCQPKIVTDVDGMDRSKINGVKRLLKKGLNISTTHQLFSRFTTDLIDMLTEKDYTLVMDETIDLLQQVNLHDADLSLLEDGTIKIHSSGRVEWLMMEQPDKGVTFSHIKTLCDNNELQINSKKMLFRLMSKRTFAAFKDAYIMTYLFERQPMRYYFDAYNVKYTMMYADETGIHPGKDKRKYSLNINLFQNSKFNGEGLSYKKYALSMNWQRNEQNLEAVKKMLKLYIRYYCGSGSNDCLWTIFKRYKKQMQGDGQTKGFIPLNSMATNKYGNRHNVAYVVNRFMNADVVNCYRSLGIDFDNNWFALCEMLQFLWRSAIRNGEAVNVWIPSKRMRDYFVEWYNSVSDTPMKYEEPLLYSVYDEDDFKFQEG